MGKRTVRETGAARGRRLRAGARCAHVVDRRRRGPSRGAVASSVQKKDRFWAPLGFTRGCLRRRRRTREPRRRGFAHTLRGRVRRPTLGPFSVGETVFPSVKQFFRLRNTFHFGKTSKRPLQEGPLLDERPWQGPLRPAPKDLNGAKLWRLQRCLKVAEIALGGRVVSSSKGLRRALGPRNRSLVGSPRAAVGRAKQSCPPPTRTRTSLKRR